ELITKVRNLRNEYNVAPSKPLNITLVSDSSNIRELLKTYEPYLVKFLNTKDLSIVNHYDSSDAVLLTQADLNIFVEKSDLIDMVALKQSLLKQKETLEKEIERSEGLLNNPSFIAKAPEAKKQIEQAKYEDYKKQYEVILEKL